jgi:hypothetical protein
VNNFKVGDLLIRERDKRPCVVVEVGESEKREWGTVDANRRRYRLFDGDGSDQWYPDTVMHACFHLPVP